MHAWNTRFGRRQVWRVAGGLAALAVLAILVGWGRQRSSAEAASPASDRQPSIHSPVMSVPLALRDAARELRGIEIADKKKPFQFSEKADEFPKDLEWLNTGGPIRLRDLKGKFVLLDFWTYCCINCMHILPELKKLEQQYPNELVVIGVHSAKFEGEKDSKNIEDAILRYEIEHPVLNDPDHQVWNSFQVQSWPTIVLIDPEGQVVGTHNGEFKAELVDQVIKKALPYYREKKLLNTSPIKFDLAHERRKPTPLRYPGKVLADPAGNRLFVADSNHNRIVIAGLDGKLQQVYGTGELGAADGDLGKATFNHPQGMALHGETLYVADTENHLLRKIDLTAKRVSTVSGTGEQSKVPFPGLDRVQDRNDIPDRWVGKPKVTALNSPWDLWIHEQDLYIAMAGPHQIWKMPLDEQEIGPYSGNGREDIVDGTTVPRLPGAPGYASFAQPSGLTSDGTWLFVADSEGSSIRAVPFDPNEQVRTVIGTAHLPGNRLFHFGDVDGVAEKAKLQHCLGVAYHDGKIFVADTYNNKIRVVDAKSGSTKTFAGTGKSGTSDEPAQFDEPAGINYADGKLYVADTNNHLIRVVDAKSGKVSTLSIAGLAPPLPPKSDRKPSFASATQVKVTPQTVKPVDGAVQFDVSIELPKGWKTNENAKVSYWVEAEGDSGPLDRKALGMKKLASPAAKFSFSILASGSGTDTVTVSLPYYFCKDGSEGLCRVASVVFTVPIKVSDDGAASAVTLKVGASATAE